MMPRPSLRSVALTLNVNTSDIKVLKTCKTIVHIIPFNGNKWKGCPPCARIFGFEV